MEIEIFDDTMDAEEAVVDQLENTKNVLTTASLNFGELELVLLNADLTADERDSIGNLLLGLKAGIDVSINVVDEQIEKMESIESGTQILGLEYKACEAKGEQLAGVTSQNKTLEDQLNNLELALLEVTNERDRLQGTLDAAQEQSMEVLGFSEGGQYKEEIAKIEATRKKENQAALDRVKELEAERNRLITAATKSRKTAEEQETKHQELVKRLKGEITGLGVNLGTVQEQLKVTNATLTKNAQQCQNEIISLNTKLSATVEKELKTGRENREAIASKNEELKKLRQECETALRDEHVKFRNLQDLASEWENRNNQLSLENEQLREEGVGLLEGSGTVEREKALLALENNKLENAAIENERENERLLQQLEDSSRTIESLEALEREKQEALENQTAELNDLTQKERDLAEKLLAAQKREAEVSASLLKLQEANNQLLLEASRIATEARDTESALQETTLTLKNTKEQVALLTSDDLSGAIQANTVLLQKQELEQTTQLNNSLRTELSVAKSEIDLLKKQATTLNTQIEKAVKEKEAATEAKKLVDGQLKETSSLLKKPTLYTISVPEGAVKRETTTVTLKQLLETTEKPSLLVIDDERKKMIESSAPYSAQLQKLEVFSAGKYPRLLTVDRSWKKDYVGVERSTFTKLRDDLALCKSGGGVTTILPVKTTSTTSTTSVTGTISTTGTTTVKGKVLTLGATMGVVSHIDALNQRGWQDRAFHLRETPSEYAAVVRFYRSDLLYGVREELTFIASNVHKIEDPNYPGSGDSYYVIDVATADTREHLRYTNVGSLIIPAFYGHGSLEIVISSKTSGDLVKGEDIDGYVVEASTTRPYNTKMMISLSDDIIVYARDTGRDTFILETLLIKA